MTPITLLGDTPTNAGEPPETFLGSFSDTKEIFSITTSDVGDCSLCAHVLDLEVIVNHSSELQHFHWTHADHSLPMLVTN